MYLCPYCYFFLLLWNKGSILYILSSYVILLSPYLAWVHQEARGKTFSWCHHFGGKNYHLARLVSDYICPSSSIFKKFLWIFNSVILFWLNLMCYPSKMLQELYKCTWQLPPPLLLVVRPYYVCFKASYQFVNKWNTKQFIISIAINIISKSRSCP